MPPLSRPFRRRAAARWRRLFLEPLEDRSLLAAVITVNSTLDTDERDTVLTLREAIEVSNRTLTVGELTAQEQVQVVGTPTANSIDSIRFNIPGEGLQTISPDSELPAIVDGVIIDGYTQPGAKPNTNGPELGSNAVILIQLSGANVFAAVSGLSLFSNNSTVTGLSVNQFLNGIELLGGSGNVIAGNFIGTDASGTVPAANSQHGVFVQDSANNTIGGTTPKARNVISNNLTGIGISSSSPGNIIAGNLVGTDASGTLSLGNFVEGIATYFDTSGALIGGTTPAARNIISGNNTGVSVSGDSTDIQGNFIGTDVTGTQPVGNAVGIQFGQSNNGTVGGLSAGAGNVISGNSGSGIQFFASSNHTIQGNLIGVAANGSSNLGNGNYGILIQADPVEPASNNNRIEQNIIAFNGTDQSGAGIAIEHKEPRRNTGNSILQNSTFSNIALGIDLNDDGATLNDLQPTADTDTGSNNLQNYPQLNSATVSGGAGLTLNYSVSSSTANSAYPLRVEFFKADATGKQGQTFLGFDTYTAAQALTAKTISFTSPISLGLGERIVATATDSAGNTSEFSIPIFTQGPTCGTVVTNTSDSGSGSLSDAITCANNVPGKDTVAFNIPGTGVQTFSGGLTITDPVLIDGYTQPGASPNTNGPGQGDNAAIRIQLFGVAIDADNSVVRGLSIRGSSNGIFILPGRSNNVVEGNFIGVDPSGATPGTPNAIGIQIGDGATSNTIGGTTPAARNVISANGGSGIYIFGSANTVAGNIIGLDPSGTVPLGHNNGVVIQGNDNLIGGTTPGARNVISGNSQPGITISGVNSSGPPASGNKIQGNFIGTDVTGTIGFSLSPPGATGIAFIGLISNTLIGGSEAGAGNVISGNSYGIDAGTETMSGTVIEGNYIGTDFSGTHPLGNLVGIAVPGDTAVGGASSGIGILGTDAFTGNLISGNKGEGLLITGSRSRVIVQGNLIGTTRDGMGPLGNGVGVEIYGSTNTIGGIQAGEGNVIANNASHGISASFGASNSILGNSIFNNASLGIDLGGDGPTPNDPGDADTGPNNLQNFPVISAATATGGQFAVNYGVPSDVANSQYPIRVQFFKADANGQGQTFLGDDLYEATEAGTVASIVFTPLAPLTTGDKIVATATDNAGNTSEFSAAVMLPLCSTIVTNTNDSGGGSLRDAITCANAVPGTDTIGFNIPGSGVHTISPTSPLPAISDPLIIDGYTQPGATPNTNGPGLADNAVPQIELNGSSAGNTSGLSLNASDSTIRGLVINRFHGPAISIVGMAAGNATAGGGSNNVVEGNFLGTSADGKTALGNLQGIAIQATTAGVADSNRIGGPAAASRNLISGNNGDNGNYGIFLNAPLGSSVTNTVIQGNFIGTDIAGTTAIPNALAVYGNPDLGVVSGVIIGGSQPGQGNLISGNEKEGIGLVTTGLNGHLIQGNKIGTDITGALPLGNGNCGICIDSIGQIGGTGPGEANIIAFNSGQGVDVVGHRTSILGNSIFTNGALGIDLGNDGPTPNDSIDDDTGANNLQNFPEIGHATKSAGMLKVTYNVPSHPSQSKYPLHIEFFRADADGQEGQTYLGSDTFTTADYLASGKTVTFSAAATIKVFDKIVATATDSLADGSPANTSEFSTSAVVASPWQNPRKRLDVNDDTHVAANDAVAIINYINAFEPGAVPANAAAGQPFGFIDTNGDNNVAPNDALDVINAINAGQAGEGESTSADNDLMMLLAIDVASESKRRR